MMASLKRYSWVLAVCLLILTTLAAPALAQEGEITVTADDVNRVASRLYCPQCESIPLDACGMQACVAWRQQSKDFLAEGYTDQEIVDYFVEQYGQRVLELPSDPLINLLLAAAPILALVVGGGIFYWQYRKWQRNRPASAGAAADAPPAEAVASNGSAGPPADDAGDGDDDDYRARLERELDEVS